MKNIFAMLKGSIIPTPTTINASHSNPNQSGTTTKSISEQIIVELTQKRNDDAAKNAIKFHAENDVEPKDIFLGVPKTVCKDLAQKFSPTATFEGIAQLLSKPEHETKLVASLILIEKNKTSAKECYAFYFKHLATFTSWDLIDLTAPIIIGNYLQTRPQLPRNDLYTLAKSRSDWDKRIAIIATLAFIEQNDFADAKSIAKIYFNEISPMILRAAGRVLRQIGKKNRHVLLEFLAQNHTQMPAEIFNAAVVDLPKQLRTTIRKETKIIAKK